VRAITRKTYNQRVSHRALSTAGRSLLVGAGFALGLCLALKSARRDRDNGSLRREIGIRLERIERAIDRMAAGRPLPPPDGPADLVTHEELVSALAAVESRVEDAILRIEEAVGARFAVQSLSVGALKTTIGSTDELLARVLDALESHWRGAEIRDPDQDPFVRGPVSASLSTSRG
jgi:hypothetical protein